MLFTNVKNGDEDLLWTMWAGIQIIRLHFADIDECFEGSFTCNENAECFNNDGSYDCFCNPGYEGDGQQCSGKFLMSMFLNLCSVSLHFVKTDAIWQFFIRK